MSGFGATWSGGNAASASSAGAARPQSAMHARATNPNQQQQQPYGGAMSPMQMSGGRSSLGSLGGAHGGQAALAAALRPHTASSPLRSSGSSVSSSSSGGVAGLADASPVSLYSAWSNSPVTGASTATVALQERAASRPATAAMARTAGGSGGKAVPSSHSSSASTTRPGSAVHSRPGSLSRPNSSSSGGGVHVAPRSALQPSALPQPAYTTPFGQQPQLHHQQQQHQSHGPSGGVAPLDVARIESLKRDIRAMSHAIRACVAQTVHQASMPHARIVGDRGQEQAQQQQMQLATTSSKFTPVLALPDTQQPPFPALPAPLLSQLSGSNQRPSSATALRKNTFLGGGADEEKEQTVSGAGGAGVDAASWDQMVSRALDRPASDPALASGMLLDLWGAQMARLVATILWRADAAMADCAAFVGFRGKHAARTHAEQPQQQQQQLFSFTSALGSMLPGADSNGNSSAPRRALLSGSASAGSLTPSHSPAASSGSSGPSDSALSQCLPALMPLLERIQTLTGFVAFAEAQFVAHKAQLQRNRQEHNKLMVELDVLSQAVREAAEDRPKTTRVIHEHRHVHQLVGVNGAASGRAAGAAPLAATEGDGGVDEMDEFTERQQRRRRTKRQSQSQSGSSADNSRSSTRPSSAVRASPSLRIDAATPTGVGASSIIVAGAASVSTPGTSGTPSVESLQHEIWLLRQSLEEERRVRVSVVDDQQAQAASFLAEQEALLAEAQRRAQVAEAEASSARETLALKSAAWDLSLKRLQAQLERYERAEAPRAAASLRADQEALFAARWAEHEAHRERVEKERWAVHVKLAAETQAALTAAQAELERTRAERESLRREAHSLRTEGEEERARILARQGAWESERKMAEMAAAKEAASRAKFEESLVAKRKALEKETKQLRDKEDAASVAARDAAEESQRLRRELAALREELAESQRRESSRAKEWIAQAAVANAQGRDVGRSEAARKEAEKRMGEMEAAHRDALAQAQQALAASVQRAEELKRALSDCEALLGELRAQTAHLTSQQAILQSELASRKSEAQERASRVVALETELATLQTTHKAVSTRLAELRDASAGETQALRAQLAGQLECIAELEETVQRLQAQLQQQQQSQSGPMSPHRRLASPMVATRVLSPSHSALSAQLLSPSSSSKTPSRSPSSASLLLASPSRGSLNAAAAGGAPSSPAMRAETPAQEAARRELEREQAALRAAQQALAVADTESARARAVLAQQQSDLLAEQQLLQTSAAMLHGQLLSKLTPLLSLNFAAVSRLGEATGPLPGLTLVAVDELREQIRAQTELTDAVHSNLANEIRSPSTQVHKRTLAERLEALRRACEFHEQRLIGLQPSGTTVPAGSTGAHTFGDSVGGPSTDSPKRALFNATSPASSPARAR